MADKAWQLHRKIDDVLEAASIESNTLPAQKSDVDLRDVVKRAVERARSRAELTGARITTTLGPDRVPVDADPRQLGRILDNLLNNGLTFTTRLPRLEVTSIAEHERAIVRVSDNGVGFSETERDSVFEPFHPTQNPSFADLRGLGLGLYIARQLAEANTGRLSIERTSAGQGTVFALVLPLAKSTTHRQPHA
jgi:signal transduction histidine kinase